MAKYDKNLVIVGGGAAGLIAAFIATTVGARAALIEKDKTGGDCLNTGCIPSKTLIHSAKAAYDQSNSRKYGIGATSPKVSFQNVMLNIERAVETIAPKDSFERYRDLGVDCFAGEARLLDRHQVEVNGQTISTKNIILATGAQPIIPAIPGLLETQPLTSETLWKLGQLPENLLIIGAGAIGCEIAQGFSRLGSKVTVVDIEKEVLQGEDQDVSYTLSKRFSDEGINLHLGYEVSHIKPLASGAGIAYASNNGASIDLQFDRVCVAVGRLPSLSGLGLNEVGVELEDGQLKLDRYLRTTVKNIFACGDVAGPYQLTHMASHQAWYAAVNALFGMFRKFPVDYSVVPRVIYTDPEIATVGLSERLARLKGLEVEVTRFSFTDLDRAVAHSEEEGWIKVLTKPGSDKILGATIVGAHAGELLAEYVLAMTHNLGLKKIMGTIHAYPTWSESSKLLAGIWRKNNAPNGLLPWASRFHKLMRRF